VRFHSDIEKSFLGDVYAFIEDKAWLKTTTEGYDSNGNSVVERRNKKLNQALRAMLVDATGGRLYYEELWDAAMDHAHDIINHMPEAGEESPVQKAGGVPLDIDHMCEVFGALVYYYEAPERRSIGAGQTDTSGRKAIYVGRSRTVSGGHKVMPIEYREGVWHIGAMIERAYCVVKNHHRPLRTAAEVGSDPTKFEDFVHRCSATAEQPDVYTVDKIVDVRITSGEVEYRVKWRGYTSRENTWEPADNLIAHGAEDTVRQWHTRNKDKIDPLKLAYMVMMVEEVSDTERTVQDLMNKHKLEGSLSEWVGPYNEELEKVISTRLDELHGDEYKRVMKEEKVVPLRMNPEPKKEGRKKMRLIVKGFLEPAEWDDKTDSPTAMSSTIRQLIAMGAQLRLVDGDLWLDMEGEYDVEDDVITIGDIRTAFLFGKEYGPDDRPRYVSYRPYKGAHTRVFRLKGPLYGQRGAPYVWWETLSEFMVEQGFIQSKNDPCLYHKPAKLQRVELEQKDVAQELVAQGYIQSNKDSTMYYYPGMTVSTHVDDLITRGHRRATELFWVAVRDRFDVKEVGMVEYDTPQTYCAKRISKVKVDGEVWYTVDQTQDIKVFIEDNQMTGVRAQSAPMPDKHEIASDPALLSEQDHKKYRSQVGSLSYFNETRHDIAYEVARLAQGLAAPTKGHQLALRRVMAYLSTMPDEKLWVKRVMGDTWHTYSDSDHAGDTCTGTNRSHTGVIILLNGMPVYWRSNKQPVTSVSSACAEIYALSEACRDVRLIAWVAEDMNREVPWPMVVYVDNAAGVSFQHDTCASSKLKGVFNYRWTWVMELRDQTQVTAVKVATDKNLADLYTKCHNSTTRQVLKKELATLAANIPSRRKAVCASR
jgi:hypothetical protein